MSSVHRYTPKEFINYFETRDEYVIDPQNSLFISPVPQRIYRELTSGAHSCDPNAMQALQTIRSICNHLLLTIKKTSSFILSNGQIGKMRISQHYIFIQPSNGSIKIQAQPLKIEDHVIDGLTFIDSALCAGKSAFTIPANTKIVMSNLSSSELDELDQQPLKILGTYFTRSLPQSHSISLHACGKEAFTWQSPDTSTGILYFTQDLECTFQKSTVFASPREFCDWMEQVCEFTIPADSPLVIADANHADKLVAAANQLPTQRATLNHILNYLISPTGRGLQLKDRTSSEELEYELRSSPKIIGIAFSETVTLALTPLCVVNLSDLAARMFEDKRAITEIDGELHLFGLDVALEDLQAGLSKIVTCPLLKGRSFSINFSNDTKYESIESEGCRGIAFKPAVGNTIDIQLQTSKDFILAYIKAHPAKVSIIEDISCSAPHAYKWIMFHCIFHLLMAKTPHVMHFSTESIVKTISFDQDQALSKAVATIKANDNLMKRFKDIMDLSPQEFDNQDWGNESKEIKTLMLKLLDLTTAELQGGDFLISVTEATAELRKTLKSDS